MPKPGIRILGRVVENELKESASGSRIVLITGGTSGIGLATVRRFLESGDQVVTCARNPFDPESKLIHDGKLDFQSVDLSQRDSGRNWVSRAIDRWGRVDILINNAASVPMKPINEFKTEEFEMALKVNLQAAFETTQAAFQNWKQEKRGGVLVNLSSMAAVDPFEGFSVYGACKAWIELFTKSAADEGREHGIFCCSIRAGAVETPLLRRVLPSFPAEDALTSEFVAERIWEIASNPDWDQHGMAIPVVKE